MLRSKLRFFGIVVAELRILNYELTFRQCALRAPDESTSLSLSVLSCFSLCKDLIHYSDYFVVGDSFEYGKRQEETDD
jgi:hypothetical protein